MRAKPKGRNIETYLITCGMCGHKWDQPNYPDEKTVCPRCGYKVGAEMKKHLEKYIKLGELAKEAGPTMQKIESVSTSKGAELRLKSCGWCRFYEPYPGGGHSFHNDYWVGDGRCRKHKKTTVVGDSCDDWEKNIEKVQGHAPGPGGFSGHELAEDPDGSGADDKSHAPAESRATINPLGEEARRRSVLPEEADADEGAKTLRLTAERTPNDDTELAQTAELVGRGPRQKREVLREFERALDFAKLKALSKASLERPLSPGEFREFRELAGGMTEKRGGVRNGG